MKIRSITFFLDPHYPVDAQRLRVGGDFLRIAQPAFVAAGYEVQSSRLATVPFPRILPQLVSGELVRVACELEATAFSLGYAYVCMGPALPELPESYEIVPEALANTRNVFFSGSMTTRDGKVSLPAIRRCAEIIRKVSTISADGFGNLRFAALANVPAGSPFFPAAYHQGEEASFSLAIEAADLAIAAFKPAASLDEGRKSLIKMMEENAHTLTEVARSVESQSRVKFMGIDFSLAPFPSEELSLGTALEQIGVPALGLHGSLAAAAILADTIDQADFMRAGFNGLFMPVLEDATLAKRVVDSSLGVMDLLLYSAVCGTGLDIIPLPGEVSSDEIYAVLVDLASLSSRLSKPLTARLMPIPGKKAGELTQFDFAFFTNSRILPLRAKPLGKLLAGNETFALHSYKK